MVAFALSTMPCALAGNRALNAINHEPCEPTTVERRVYLSCSAHPIALSAAPPRQLIVAGILTRTTSLTLMRLRSQHLLETIKPSICRKPTTALSGCSGVLSGTISLCFPLCDACPIGFFAAPAR